jgi:hypothetical protein
MFPNLNHTLTLNLKSTAKIKIRIKIKKSAAPSHTRAKLNGSAPRLCPRAEGETFARALVIRPSLVGVGFRNESQRSGDCNGNFRIFERRTAALPLLGERVGVRENEANSNPRRTTIPRTVKLRESPDRARGFPNLVMTRYFPE